MKENVRSRKFRLLLYPDCPAHVEALKLIELYPKYSYILHDKDKLEDGSLKKPHWHVSIWFSNAKWRDALSKELGVEPNYIQPSNNSTHDLRYLVHADDPDKFQYDVNEIHTNMKIDIEKALTDVNEEEKVIKILDILNSIDGVISTDAYVRMVCAAGLYSEFRRSSFVFLQVLNEHNRRWDKYYIEPLEVKE